MLYLTIFVAALAFTPVSFAGTSCSDLLTRLDLEFEGLNATYERTLWGNYNAHAGVSAEDRRRTEAAVQDFINDPGNLARTERELARPDLTGFDRSGLEGYRRLFAVNAISDPAVIVERDALMSVEAKFAAAHTELRTGYVDPDTKDFVVASPPKMTLIVGTDPNPSLRRAARDGLQVYERDILNLDLAAIFRQRNRFARSLGYPDYYEYKTQAYEGLSKHQIFSYLEDLEEKTRAAGRAAYDALASRVGPIDMLPWNVRYAMNGDLPQRQAKYFPASEALLRWGQTFYNLGIDFRGGTTRIDLVARPGKHGNGFMRSPVHSFLTRDGFNPAEGNFTANAILDKPTAGTTFTATLHHEGGHNAHYGNSGMPGASYLTEFAPSSIALAETQAIFMDRFLGDPAWLSRYAKTVDGEPMPIDLMEEKAVEGQRYAALNMREMMITPFMERALYELADDQMTPANFVRIARAVEKKLGFQEATRPALIIPHIQASEAAAYYHAYIMAYLAVEQTRAFLLERDGYIVDNPKVAATLKTHYWEPGNSIDFLTMVKNLTGHAFSTDALVAKLNRSLDEARAAVGESLAGVAHARPRPGPIDLNLNIIMEHGDQVVTATSATKSFEAMAAEYGEWIKIQTRLATAAAAE